MKAFDHEIVSGSVLRSVWKLAWPVVLLNLVNGLHGFVDHVLIGRYVPSASNAANAAVGVAWQVFLVMVVLLASLFHGMNVLIARYAGQQDRANMSRVAYHAFLATIITLVGVVAPAGYFLAPGLLEIVRAEPEVRAHALPYLRILFTCGAPIFLMFMFSGAFHASGDPKTPLFLGILATVLNVCFSLVLIPGVEPFDIRLPGTELAVTVPLHIPAFGAAGAAMGTVLAPLVSVIIAITIVFRHKTILQPPERFTLVPNITVLRRVARIGIPTGVQGVALNVGGVALLAFIGSLQESAAAQAAYTICYAQLFSLVSWPGIGLRSAAGTVMGQNIGAGDPQRGKTAVALAAKLGALWGVGVGLLFWFFPGPLLGLFGATEEPVHGYGVSLLHFLAISGVLLVSTQALTGGIQGAGETVLPMIIAMITQIGVLLGVCAFFTWFGGLTPERVWLAILIGHFTRLVLTYAVFRTERWAHKQVELHK